MSDLTPIRYTSRDFSSIKEKLLEYAKRYYPETYKDFNEASFGSLTVDMVSYIGDILSFYLDYQANESFLETSIEYDNIIKHARPLGYRFKNSLSAFGMADMYVLIPSSTTTTGPDMDYAPVLLRGTRFSTKDGVSFVLNEDVSFDNSNNEVIVARVDDTTGTPTYFAIKAVGQVVSGEFVEDIITVGDFEKFLKVELSGENISEVVSVTDSEGHEYIEVDFLSQDVVYRPILNREEDALSTKNILKAVPAPRRFIVESFRSKTFLQFGYGSDSELTDESVANPSNLVLNRFGKDFISDPSFDPTKLTSTDKFGIAPSNTTLRVVYRVNSVDNVNASSNSLTTVVRPIFSFKDPTTLLTSQVKFVANSLEVSNELAISGDITLLDPREIKIRAKDTFAAQNRAVTRLDYVSAIYNMPQQFGGVKRATIIRDDDSFKRNLNIYVISEAFDGSLAPATEIIKKNLKTWLSGVKMINDTVDILDARVVNIGIEYKAIAKSGINKYSLLNEANIALVKEFNNTMEIGEPFLITDVFKALKDVDGVLDVIDVKIINKIGGVYSDVDMDIDKRTSADGRYIAIPEDHIFEIKFPFLDIKGDLQ